MMLGKRINIIEATNKNLQGIQGEVIEETRNMLVISTIEGIKKVIKRQIIRKEDE